MVDICDAELSEAKLRWQIERPQHLIPSSVHFDRTSGRIFVEFTNDAAFMVPAQALEGLEGATDDQLSEVELLGETGLHWESLDVDYTIAGLMNGVFGSKALTEVQSRGGSPARPRRLPPAGPRRQGRKASQASVPGITSSRSIPPTKKGRTIARPAF